MIIHKHQRRPNQVRIVNSRLPVYKYIHGNGFGDIVGSLVTRVIPKIGPVIKQFGLKAIGKIGETAISGIGNLASKGFNAIKDKILSLVRKKQPVKLPITSEMPPEVSKAINDAANKKINDLAQEAAITNLAQEVANTNLAQNVARTNLANTSFVSGDGLRFRRYY